MSSRIDVELFRHLFPNNTDSEMREVFGMSRSAVRRLAHRLGLRKSAAHWSRMQRERNVGRSLSADARAKLATRATGRRLSPETIAKALSTKRERGTILSGDRHPNWKGGRPWERFKRPEYLAWRNAVLARDGYRCQDCGRQCRKHEKGLAAHHIKSFADHPVLRYDVDNGVTLCRDCHNARHGKIRKTIEIRPCACGCGQIIATEDRYGRPRRYVNHHHPRGIPKSERTKAKLRAKRIGRSLTTEHRRRISIGLRTSTRRIGRPPTAR
ncbi:MAG TPA: HNH endonuclease [Candidatus Limnocylindria bacterium]